MEQISVIQQVLASASTVDAKGNAVSTTFPTPPVWTVDNAALLTVTAAANGLSAECVAVGALGTATVTVTGTPAGATSPITGSAQIQLVAAPAAAFTITFAAPEIQSPNPPPPPPPPTV